MLEDLTWLYEINIILTYENTFFLLNSCDERKFAISMLKAWF